MNQSKCSENQLYRSEPMDPVKKNRRPVAMDQSMKMYHNMLPR
jgi:hypothetical protein